jgi:hypothetical protein
LRAFNLGDNGIDRFFREVLVPPFKRLDQDAGVGGLGGASAAVEGRDHRG